jgi:cysteine synthase A
MTVIYDNNALSIGNTPLVRLNRVVNGHQKVYAKIEGRILLIQSNAVLGLT